ncbi:penicillin-binding protein [uncultured Cedecea sp.]|uniref:penicillin-binding protein n=1 Tax=uncultured Cedecea sp. TaxID=988762 RepID=UPI0026158AFA|nr:penicillin-binding protein [uncultured Cedecea sp.]
MHITITIADTDIEKFSEKQYDAYASELEARVKEIYPESNVIVTHYDGVTHSTVDGFHDNEKVRIVIHELQQDVFLHGYWRK